MTGGRTGRTFALGTHRVTMVLGEEGLGGRRTAGLLPEEEEEEEEEPPLRCMTGECFTARRFRQRS